MLNRIANFVLRIALFVFFFLVLTPIGLIRRAFGKDYLSRSFNQDTSSYWIRRQ